MPSQTYFLFEAPLDRVWTANLKPADATLSNTEFRRLVDKYMDHPLAVGNWWKPFL